MGRGKTLVRFRVRRAGRRPAFAARGPGPKQLLRRLGNDAGLRAERPAPDLGAVERQLDAASQNARRTGIFSRLSLRSRILHDKASSALLSIWRRHEHQGAHEVRPVNLG